MQPQAPDESVRRGGGSVKLRVAVALTSRRRALHGGRMSGLTSRFAAMFCGTLIGILPMHIVAADATSIETEIARWERRAKEKPDDVIALAALGHARIRQARETGDLGAYRPAEVALQAA